MLTRVVDRSADGSRFQLQCECCGVGLDWVTGLELTCMAVKGLRNLCFDCAGEMANLVHPSLLTDFCIPDQYQFLTVVNGEMVIHDTFYTHVREVKADD